jgi:hypothetical protein
MILHQYKPLNFGVGILAPEQNIGAIMCTVRSLRNNYPNIPFICVVPKDASPTTIEEISNVCPVYKGKNTITSLMNTAIRRGCKEWNLLIMEGAVVRSGIVQKYSLFIDDITNVLFPIVMDRNRKGEPCNIRNKFHDASLNGTFIHQKTFKNIGDFSDESLIESKLWWAVNAINKGTQFKAILGTQLL